MIQVIKHEILSGADTIARLRKTRLKGFGQPEIYKDASITVFSEMDPNLLTPPSDMY